MHYGIKLQAVDAADVPEVPAPVVLAVNVPELPVVNAAYGLMVPAPEVPAVPSSVDFERLIHYAPNGDVLRSPWCADSPVMSRLWWQRVYLYRLCDPAPGASASLHFLWIVFKFWVLRTLSVACVSTEVKQFLVRRWVLASRPGPVCLEDYQRIDNRPIEIVHPCHGMKRGSGLSIVVIGG